MKASANIIFATTLLSFIVALIIGIGIGEHLQWESDMEYVKRVETKADLELSKAREYSETMHDLALKKFRESDTPHCLYYIKNNMLLKMDETVKKLIPADEAAWMDKCMAALSSEKLIKTFGQYGEQL